MDENEQVPLPTQEFQCYGPETYLKEMAVYIQKKTQELSTSPGLKLLNYSKHTRTITSWGFVTQICNYSWVQSSWNKITTSLTGLSLFLFFSSQRKIQKIDIYSWIFLHKYSKCYLRSEKKNLWVFSWTLMVFLALRLNLILQCLWESKYTYTKQKVEYSQLRFGKYIIC